MRRQFSQPNEARLSEEPDSILYRTARRDDALSLHPEVRRFMNKEIVLRGAHNQSF